LVIVDGNVSREVQQNIEKEMSEEATQEEIEQDLLERKEGEVVHNDLMFTKPNGKVRRGYYLDGYLKSNLDEYFIKAVKKKWDGVMLITGMEGSAKSTNAFSIAKYVDPGFPGEPLDDGTSRRHCDRIVFTPQQTIEAIDTSKPGQAIVMDEAVLNFLAQDASSDVQKLLIKKMVTIRKKRLFIFIVIPSIFLLRKYIAIFRTRALIHFYSPDGFSRGYGKVYSYDTKRKLYVRGIKEFNQDCVQPDFRIRATDTTGYFFDDNEYQLKKNMAIKELTTDKDNKKDEKSKKIMKVKNERNNIALGIYEFLRWKKPTLSYPDMAAFMKEDLGVDVSSSTVNRWVSEGLEYRATIAQEQEDTEKRDKMIDNYKQRLKEKVTLLD